MLKELKENAVDAVSLLKPGLSVTFSTQAALQKIMPMHLFFTVCSFLS